VFYLKLLIKNSTGDTKRRKIKRRKRKEHNLNLIVVVLRIN